MANTWTVVKFCEEDSVEAVPTTWLVGSDRCYWPPFTQNKVLQAIKKHDAFCTSWPLHKVEVFRCGTYENYLQARNKARRAEYESDLNTDCDNKINRKVRHKKNLSSDDNEDSDSSGSELMSSQSKENFHRKYISPPKMISRPILEIEEGETSRSNISSKPTGTTEAVDVEPTCSCCSLHKYDQTLKSIQNQQVLIKNILTQVLDELQQLKMRKMSEKEGDDSISLFSQFKFLPINDEEHLKIIEEYLEEDKNFSATIDELSRLGGSCVYDFVKRCMTAMLTNSFAAEFSWQGMKKKKVFSSLKLAKVLIGACEKVNLAESTKASEEAIKKWLRRAKERSANEKKKNDL